MIASILVIQEKGYLMNQIDFIIMTITSLPYWVYLFRWAVLAFFPGAILFTLTKRYIVKNEVWALVISQVFTGSIVFFLDDKIFKWFFSLVK